MGTTWPSPSRWLMRHGALQHDEHAGTRLRPRRTGERRARSGARCRTGRCVRSRARSAPETSGAATRVRVGGVRGGHGKAEVQEASCSVSCSDAVVHDGGPVTPRLSTCLRSPMSAFSPATEVWLAAGVRTPFAKVDGPLAGLDAIELSRSRRARTWSTSCDGGAPDFAVWGTVVPNLTWSNIAREVLMDAGVAADDPRVLDRDGVRDQHDRRDRGRRHDRRRRAAISRSSAASRA